jgi:hypothetical protein
VPTTACFPHDGPMERIVTNIVVTRTSVGRKISLVRPDVLTALNEYLKSVVFTRCMTLLVNVPQLLHKTILL